MPFQSLTPDLQRKVTMAIQAGAPAEEAMRRAESMSQSSQPSNNLAGLAQRMLSPFERVSRQIDGAGYELLRPLIYRDDPNTEINESFYDPQARQARQNPFLPEQLLKEKFSDYGSALKEGAKTTAGLAAYGIPLGGATKLGGLAIGAPASAGLKASYVLPGAVSGALFESSTPDATPLSVGGAGLVGGAVGGLIGGASKALKGIGGGAQKSIVNPKVKAKPTAALDEQRLVSESERLLGRGSAQTLRQRSGNLYNSLIQQIDKVLGASKEALPLKGAGSVDDIIKQGVATRGQYFIPDDPVHRKLVGQEIKNMKRMFGKNITAKNLFDYKMFLSRNLGPNAFRKSAGELGTSLGPRAGIQMDFWHVLDDLITQLVPAAKQATEKMSTLHKLAPGLQTSAQKGLRASLPFLQGFSTKIPGGQTAQAAIGGAAQKAGSLLGGGAPSFSIGKLSGATPNPLPAIAGQMLKGGGGGQPQAPLQQQMRDNRIQTQLPPQGGAPLQGAGPMQMAGQPTVGQTYAGGPTRDNQITNQLVDSGQLPPNQAEIYPQQQAQLAQQMMQPQPQAQQPLGLSKEQMAMAMLALPPNEAAKLVKAYEFMQPPEAQGTTAGTQKRLDALRRVGPVLKRLSQYTQSPTGVAGALASNLGRIPGVEGGGAEFLRRENQGFARLIANVFAGETGVATDEDVKRWQGLLPMPGDTGPERKDRMDNLVNQINQELFSLGVDPKSFGVDPGSIGYGTIQGIQ